MDYKLIDFHAHILPTLDHGCDKVKVALLQLELARSVGVKKILATSHFYPNRHTVDSFVEKRTAALNAVLPIAEEMKIEIIPAAEVLLCNGLDRLDGIEKLCIPNTKTILLELPFTVLGDEIFETVGRFIKDGFKIVLAHADRYSKKYVQTMIDLGAAIQLNASSVAKLFVKRRIKNYINDYRVVAIGSDIHGYDKRYYNAFAKAVKRLGTDAEQIFNASENIISAKQSVDFIHT